MANRVSLKNSSAKRVGCLAGQTSCGTRFYECRLDFQEIYSGNVLRWRAGNCLNEGWPSGIKAPDIKKAARRPPAPSNSISTPCANSPQVLSLPRPTFLVSPSAPVYPVASCLKASLPPLVHVSIVADLSAGSRASKIHKASHLARLM